MLVNKSLRVFAFKKILNNTPEANTEIVPVSNINNSIRNLSFLLVFVYYNTNTRLCQHYNSLSFHALGVLSLIISKGKL
jgi:hypothetical protein